MDLPYFWKKKIRTELGNHNYRVFDIKNKKKTNLTEIYREIKTKFSEQYG